MIEDATGQLRELAATVVAAAEPGEQIEAYAMREVETRVDVREGGLDQLSSAETRGVGVRVVAGGRQGYASTAVVTPDGLRHALDEARSNAAVAMPDDANGLAELADPGDVAGLVDERWGDTSVDQRIELALQLEAAARDADARVRGVDLATSVDTYTEAVLLSSVGHDLALRRTDALAYVEVLASDGDETQSGLGLVLGRSPTALDTAAAGREGAARACRLLGARKPRTRRAPVVLDPFVTAQFLGVLASALSAEAVLKGRSLFSDRLGEDVASEAVTLVDDGRLPEGPATSPWDGEGVPRRTTELIVGGRLATYLHDSWTARRTGGDARSTGNASRAGFRSSPSVAPSNLYLAPGSRTAAEVIAGVDDGVYVQDVMGLHSGANPISGDFSVSFTGLAIRDGELAEPIREAAVSSTIVDILRGVRVVGADRRFFPFGGALGGSTVLVTDMAVSGA